MGSDEVVIFTVEGRRCALPLSSVKRVVRSVEVVELPGAPDVVLGVIDLQGSVVPVMNLRKRFRLSTRDVWPSDQMIVAVANERTVALVVDSVVGLFPIPDFATAADDVLPDLPWIDGVASVGDGLVIIHDLERFLSLDEQRHLDKALSES